MLFLKKQKLFAWRQIHTKETCSRELSTYKIKRTRRINRSRNRQIHVLFHYEWLPNFLCPTIRRLGIWKDVCVIKDHWKHTNTVVEMQYIIRHFCLKNVTDACNYNKKLYLISYTLSKFFSFHTSLCLFCIMLTATFGWTHLFYFWLYFQCKDNFF